MHKPYKGIILAMSQDILKDSPIASSLQAATEVAVFFAYLFSLPVNGSMYSFILIWSSAISVCN